MQLIVISPEVNETASEKMVSTTDVRINYYHKIIS